MQIRGREIHRARAHIIVALHGSFQIEQSIAWMDGIMQFVQVNADGQPGAAGRRARRSAAGPGIAVVTSPGPLAETFAYQVIAARSYRTFLH